MEYNYEIRENIREIISRQLDIQEIKEDDDLEIDLGCDSLDIIEICFEIEDMIDIEFSDEEIEGFEFVGDIYFSVEKHLKDKE